MEKTKYAIRELRIKDFFSLHRMYDSLDEKKTKPFFHVYWLGLKPSRIKWFFTQIALFSSTLKTLRKLFFVIYPFIVFLSIVAIDERAKVIGFIFLIIRKRLLEGGFLAEFGICVGDNYRGRGIGTAMMEKLIAFAKKEHVRKITLTVRINNSQAYGLYDKFGFRRTRIFKKHICYAGRRYDVQEMVLVLE